MNFTGLTATEMLGLFGALGGAMVLLYLLKLRRRRVEVPFAPLWARVVEERQASSLFRRLKRVFSLLIQLAVIALIVLALGDPRPEGGSGCGFTPPEPPPQRHTLLLLDSSASMAALERGQTRIEQAAERAHRIVDDLGDNPAHKVMVVAADTGIRPLTLWTPDRKAAHEAIDRYAAEGARDTSSAPEEALRLAEQALRDREDAEAIFITDAAFDPIPEQRREALDLAVETVGEPRVNVGIEAFNVRPYLDDSLTYALFYAVRNTSDRPLKATLLLYANPDGLAPEDFVRPERIVGSYALELPAGGVARDVVGDLKFEGDRLAARVVVDSAEPVHDVFPRDDLAFALVPERRKLKVQLVTEANLFLEASLLVRENVDLATVAPADYAGPGGFDVTIVDSADVDVSKPGRYFLLDPQPGGPFAIQGTVEEPAAWKVDRDHPLARGLSFEDLAIEVASKVDREKGDDVVVWAEGWVPLLLTRHDDDTDRTFAALTFDVRRSRFPLNYAFPLLVVNVLNWFQPQPTGLVPTRRAGVDLSIPLNRELAAVDPIAMGIQGPDPDASARVVADRVLLNADRIGLYELTTPATDATQVVALNLMDPAESAIAPRGDYPAWTAPPPYDPPEPPFPGTPWRALLLGALVIVALEWLTWHRRLTV
ncbi:MAG: VWA domain-containing protein [Myxococcota bacterium]